MAGGVGVYFFLSPKTEGNSESPVVKVPKPQGEKTVNLPEMIIPEHSGSGLLNINKVLNIPIVKEEINKNSEKQLSELDIILNDSTEANNLKESIKNEGLHHFLNSRLHRIGLSIDSSTIDDTNKEPDVVILIQTKTDAEKLLASVISALKESHSEKTITSNTVYQFEQKDKPVLITAVNSQIIAIGSSEKIIEETITTIQANNGKKVTGDKLISFEWKGDELSVAPQQPGMPFNPADIKGVELSFDYSENKGAELNISLAMDTEDKAKATHSALSQQLGFMMGMLLGLKQDEWKLSQNSEKVSLTISMNTEKLEALIKKSSRGSSNRPTPVQKRQVQDIPKQNVSGEVHGKNFNCAMAKIQNGILTFKSDTEFFSDRSVKIFTFLKNDEIVEGKTILIPGDSRSPHVWKHWKEEGKTSRESKAYTNGYELQLKFTQVSEDFIEGEIDLNINDESPTSLKGTFKAVNQ